MMTIGQHNHGKGTDVSTSQSDWLREVLSVHFDPNWGTPFWLERLGALDVNPTAPDICIEDLPRFGPMPMAALARRPVEDFVPRRFHPVLHRFVNAETGGTTGPPKRTVFRDDEFHAAFVTPFVAAASAMGFPHRCHWLYIGPSGPHIVGKGARACASALQAMDPFSVDFDPRWFRKLPPDSVSRERYLAHVLRQALDILETQAIGVLFSTPPVLEALAEQLNPDTRGRIRGVHTGGIAAAPRFWTRVSAWFPNAAVLGGYGNTLAGVCPQVAWEPGALPVYFAHGKRLHFRLIDIGANGRGTVVFSRLDESMFLPNVIERDEASFAPLPALPGLEGFSQFGLSDPRPAAHLGEGVLQGLY